jgi:hypothetical protein
MVSFFLFYYGGAALFKDINIETSATYFLILWGIGFLLIGFVFFHWVSLIRMILKKKDDSYRGVKIICMILFSVICSWVYPFLFPIDTNNHRL